MIGFYRLGADGKTPIPSEMGFCPSVSIAADDAGEGVRVSTVFLGIDHGFRDGRPVLWETMVFGGKHDQYCRRYFSHDAALAGHTATVAGVLSDTLNSDGDTEEPSA